MFEILARRDDLTAQQKAVEQYLDVIAGARGSGPVDPIRWGAALTRVSRLTEIPVDQLNGRFKNTKRAGRRPGLRESMKRPSVEDVKPQAATEESSGLVHRIVPSDGSLAICSCTPLWHDVQRQVQVDEFTDGQNRKLAEIYWNHQRDEGEPSWRS